MAGRSRHVRAAGQGQGTWQEPWHHTRERREVQRGAGPLMGADGVRLKRKRRQDTVTALGGWGRVTWDQGGCRRPSRVSGWMPLL